MTKSFVHLDNSQSTDGGLKPSGIKLFALVYEELSKHAGPEFSATELMQAAQRLIKISKGEYIDKVSKEYVGKPQYYSLNTITAFNYYQWRIVSTETYKMKHCDYPEHSRE